MSNKLRNNLNVVVLDGNESRRSYYASAIAQLGVELDFHSSIDGLPAHRDSAQSACFIVNFASLPSSVAMLLSAMHLVPERTIALGSLPADTVQAGTASMAIRILEPVSSEVLSEFVLYVLDRYRAQIRFTQQCQETDGKLMQLTERQLRVLQHSLEGQPAKVIAQQLDVSQRTVESDRTRIMQVFGTDAMADIAVRIGEFRVLDAIRKLNQRESVIRLRPGVHFHLHDRHLVQFNTHFPASRRSEHKR